MATGGTLAEEVISTIRTAKAFGTQNTLANIYDGHVGEAHKVDLKAAFGHGIGLATFFFIIYSAYALCKSNSTVILYMSTDAFAAFSFGTTLINQGRGE